MTENKPTVYRDALGRAMVLEELLTCLCSHAAHPKGKCHKLGCGCLYYRPEVDPSAA